MARTATKAGFPKGPPRAKGKAKAKASASMAAAAMFKVPALPPPPAKPEPEAIVLGKSGSHQAIVSAAVAPPKFPAPAPSCPPPAGKAGKAKAPGKRMAAKKASKAKAPRVVPKPEASPSRGGKAEFAEAHLPSDDDSGATPTAVADMIPGGLADPAAFAAEPLDEAAPEKAPEEDEVALAKQMGVLEYDEVAVPMDVPRCSKCGYTVDPTQAGTRLTAKSPPAWKCSRCNSRHSALSRAFGSWPIQQFLALTPEEQQEFWRSSAISGPKTRAATIEWLATRQASRGNVALALCFWSSGPRIPKTRSFRAFVPSLSGLRLCGG